MKPLVKIFTAKSSKIESEINDWIGAGQKPRISSSNMSSAIYSDGQGGYDVIVTVMITYAVLD